MWTEIASLLWRPTPSQLVCKSEMPENFFTIFHNVHYKGIPNGRWLLAHCDLYKCQMQNYCPSKHLKVNNNRRNESLLSSIFTVYAFSSWQRNVFIPLGNSISKCSTGSGLLWEHYTQMRNVCLYKASQWRGRRGWLWALLSPYLEPLSPDLCFHGGQAH